MTDRGQPATLPEVAEAAVAALRARGPMTAAVLIEALAAEGLDLGRDPATTLDDALDEDSACLVLPLRDGRLVWLPALLEGRVFTHRLSACEASFDLIDTRIDLAPLSMLDESDDGRRLAGGGEVEPYLVGFDDELVEARGAGVDDVPEEGWLLPAGTFASFAAEDGDVVALGVSAEGITVERVDTGALGDGAAEAQALAASMKSGAGPELLDVTVWSVCAGDPELFRTPVAPLGEVLHAAGLALDGDHLAPAGFDFRSWRVERRIEALASMHGLDDDAALAVLVLHRLYTQVADLLDAAAAAGPDGPDIAAELHDQPADTAIAALDADATAATGDDGDERQTVRATLEFLDDPRVAEALLVEALGPDRRGAAALGLFAETLEAQAPPPARAALRWLRAKALERLGNIGEAEAALEAALGLDSGWGPALVDLARYASDRGDAMRGLALLRRAGPRADDALVDLLERHRPRHRRDIGRNDRCWCGSGRKYKHCHQGREQLAVEDRAGWLYEKARTYLHDGPWRQGLLEVAQARAAHWDFDTALLAALNDPLVVDALLVEGGVFEDFLDERGALLPDDERLVTDQWLLVDRSVFEVERVHLHEAIDVRDIRTGDRHHVRERAATTQLRDGQLICARIVPVGETMQFVGGIEPVALPQLDGLLDLLDADPTPLELVEFLSARYAPPVLRNTEGDDLVACETTLDVSDPAALAAGLTDRYGAPDTDGDGARRWIEHVTTMGVERIRATFELRDAHLRIDTNSVERAERALTVIRDLDPAATVVADKRTPIRDLAEAATRRSPGAHHLEELDPADPAVAAALAEFLRKHEDAWLDESIPALAGLTPRQAAADPTRRGELQRLLDSFDPRPAGAIAMDTNRLRRELGLE